MTTTADVTPHELLTYLRSALALITDESRWCQSAIAQDASGQSVNPLAVTAIRWCAIGAVERVTPPRYQTHVIEALHPPECVGSKIRAEWIIAVNDGSWLRPQDAHAAVCRRFERAIALVEAAISRVEPVSVTVPEPEGELVGV